MANIDRFLIAPINSGLQNDVKPWLIADDAFDLLKNVYPFRGRIKKRFGSRLMNPNASGTQAQLYSRLRIKVGTTDGAGAFPQTLMPGTIFEEGQMFSIGTEIFTVDTDGVQLSTGSGVCNYLLSGPDKGKVEFTAATPLTDVYFYPAQPVMGLLTYDDEVVNYEQLIAFDTQFSYKYNNGWDRIGTVAWTGQDYQFFWGTNYRGADDSKFTLWVTNYNKADGLRYWDGSTWTTLNPIVLADGSQTLNSAKCSVWFHQRLLFFNTIETVGAVTQTYQSRIRFSESGSATNANAFVANIAGRGGFINAPTKEAIVSCGFFKDRLIVYFERSTWELVYTGNKLEPFLLQRLNQELGVESTFSVIPFDKGIIGIGDVGIHNCNGVNVFRIDSKIPNGVFNISNVNNGLDRVYGIRDYYTELAYWAAPYLDNEYIKYPNKVIVFNYINGAFAEIDDTITCFGYYQSNTALTWETTSTWQKTATTWAQAVDIARFKSIIAGNQQGFTFIIEPTLTINSESLQITDITKVGGVTTLKILNHNLSSNTYIKITGTNSALDGGIYRVWSLTSKDEITITENVFNSTYKGGGTAALVSRIDILTKEYNFYVDQGRNAYISKVDFCVTSTPRGKITVDSFIGSGYDSQITGARATDCMLGDGVLETSPYALSNQEQVQERLWHPLYILGDGECVQLHMFLSHEQMIDVDIAESDFELQAMAFYATPTASRLQ